MQYIAAVTNPSQRAEVRGGGQGAGGGGAGLACVSCLLEGKKHNGAQPRPSSEAVSKTPSDPQLGPLFLGKE